MAKRGEQERRGKRRLEDDADRHAVWSWFSGSVNKADTAGELTAIAAAGCPFAAAVPSATDYYVHLAKFVKGQLPPRAGLDELNLYFDFLDRCEVSNDFNEAVCERLKLAVIERKRHLIGTEK